MSLDYLQNITAKQKRFLLCFEACASVTQAARWSKVTRQAHYEWSRESESYRAAFAESDKVAARTLEDEAVRRAHEGIKKVIRYKGKVVGTDTEYSDTLLLALLKGNNAKKFRDNSSVEVTGRDGKPLLDLASVEAFFASRKDADDKYENQP